MHKVLRSRWTIPAMSIGIGLVMFAASAAGGKAQLGAEMCAVMVVFGALVLLGGRSETVRGLRGDGRDERFEQIDLRATAFGGFVASLAIIGGFVFEIAHGRSGMPYTWLGAVVGVAYLGAVVVLRLRG